MCKHALEHLEAAGPEKKGSFFSCQLTKRKGCYSSNPRMSGSACPRKHYDDTRYHSDFKYERYSRYTRNTWYTDLLRTRRTYKDLLPTVHSSVQVAHSARYTRRMRWCKHQSKVSEYQHRDRPYEYSVRVYRHRMRSIYPSINPHEIHYKLP